MRGFSVVEFLVIAGVAVVVVTAAVFVLNPIEMLRQKRDAQRIADLNSIKSALVLYLASGSNPTLGGAGFCYTSFAKTAENCNGRHLGATNGSWFPVNFGDMPGGVLLTSIPIDPVNDGPYFYSYAINTANHTFELNAKMESRRYSNGGVEDVESTDGGNLPNIYEISNSRDLNF